ncbi:MAG: response regulator, partial [Dehalococcoidia bacterium]
MTEQRSARLPRVLVVDDSPEILSVLRRGLQRHGYEVVGCGDGRTALESFRHDPPDLVILDLGLPD